MPDENSNIKVSSKNAGGGEQTGKVQKKIHLHIVNWDCWSPRNWNNTKKRDRKKEWQTKREKIVFLLISIYSKQYQR
jgi:hypothetical protein